MKKILSLILAALLICSGITVFAEGDSHIISVAAFKGKLYYCDVPTERVVIKGVAPAFPTPEAAQTAREAEYLEISVAPEGIFMRDGSNLPISYVNDYADGDVWFLLAKTADGNLTIPYLTFK